jgi:hypothetical protein
VSGALLGFAAFLELTVYRGRDGLNSVWLNIPVLQTPSNGITHCHRQHRNSSHRMLLAATSKRVIKR